MFGFQAEFCCVAKHNVSDFFSKISDLYKNDPLGLELAEDFWIPLDSEGYSSALGDRHQNAMPKQVWF